MDSQTIPPPLPTTVVCGNCGNTVPASEVLTLQNAPVCAACKPIVLQRLKEGAVAIQSGLWRDDKVLVVGLNESTVHRRQATLPDQCVQCNGPAHGYRLRRKLSWHPSGYYFLILLNLLIYAIIATIVSKKAKIDIGLCPEHRHKRRNGMLVAWALFAASIISFVVAGFTKSGEVIALGALCLLASPIYGTMKCRIVSRKKIDAQHAWITGVCPEYLNSLPKWN